VYLTHIEENIDFWKNQTKTNFFSSFWKFYSNRSDLSLQHISNQIDAVWQQIFQGNVKKNIFLRLCNFILILFTELKLVASKNIFSPLFPLWRLLETSWATRLCSGFLLSALSMSLCFYVSVSLCFYVSVSLCISVSLSLPSISPKPNLTFNMPDCPSAHPLLSHPSLSLSR
jgi:hypothetical protein